MRKIMKYMTQCNWNDTWYNILTYAESIEESEENCRCLFSDRRGFRMFKSEEYKGSLILPSLGLFIGLIMVFLSFVFPAPFSGMGIGLSLLLIIGNSPRLKEIKEFEDRFKIDNSYCHYYEYEYNDCTTKEYREKLREER